MSLLMDALKKVEQAKSEAEEKQGTASGETSGSVVSAALQTHKQQSSNEDLPEAADETELSLDLPGDEAEETLELEIESPEAPDVDDAEEQQEAALTLDEAALETTEETSPLLAEEVVTLETELAPPAPAQEVEAEPEATPVEPETVEEAAGVTAEAASEVPEKTPEKAPEPELEVAPVDEPDKEQIRQRIEAVQQAALPPVAQNSSRRNFAVLLVVIVVVALGGGYYYFESQLQSVSNDFLIASQDPGDMMQTLPGETQAVASDPAGMSAQELPVAAEPVQQEENSVKQQEIPASVAKPEAAVKQPVSQKQPSIDKPVASKPSAAVPTQVNKPVKPKKPAAATLAAAKARKPVIKRVLPKTTLQQMLEAAFAAYQKGDLEKAGNGYRQALKRSPRNRDALLGLAVVNQQAGNADQARTYYRRLLELNPKDSMAISGLMSLQEGGTLVQNESRLKLMLEQEPEAAYLHYMLGAQYAAQSRWIEAQQAFFQAYHLDPENPDYSYNLAVSLDQLGQSRTAVKYYRLALLSVVGNQVGFNISSVNQRVAYLSAGAQQQ